MSGKLAFGLSAADAQQDASNVNTAARLIERALADFKKLDVGEDGVSDARCAYTFKSLVGPRVEGARPPG